MNPESEKLEKALRFIKEAYIAGIIFGTYQVVFVIVATAEGDRSQFVRLIDAVFCFGTSWGVYKKSRICAILLFLYSIAFIITSFILPTSPVAFLIFVLAFVVARGIPGTFRYHKLMIIESKFNTAVQNHP